MRRADLGELPSREREPSVSDESSQTPSVGSGFTSFFLSDSVVEAQGSYYSGEATYREKQYPDAIAKTVVCIHDKRLEPPPPGSVLFKIPVFKGVGQIIKLKKGETLLCDTKLRIRVNTLLLASRVSQC